MKKVLVFLLVVGSCLACEDELTQEQEIENLQTLLTEIERLAASVECTNAREWAVTAYGSKACGGPIGFIAYSTTIDTEYFLEKLIEYTSAQEAYNKRWNVVSDCAAQVPPTGVQCQGGSPVFIY